MGIYIDQRFYSELFESKEVNYNSKLYILLFDTIWPHSKNFELFLSSSDYSLKLEFAKKIFEDLSLINNIFLPPFTILNILNDQYHNLFDSSEGYVSQDHAVHCINTYILGVYLFFNSEKLNKKLNTHNSDSYASVKNFIIKWQIFSLYHDTGYYFECDDLAIKNLYDYKNMLNQILKACISKHLTRAIAIKFLFEKHSFKYSDNIISSRIGVWYDENGKRIPKQTIEEYTNSFKEALCINNITSDEDLNYLLSFPDFQNHLIAVYDEYGNCVCVIIREIYNIKKIISRSISLIDELIIDNIINTSNPKYKFKYFYKDINNKTWYKIINEPIVIDDINSQLPVELITDISINANNIADVLFSINNWLSKELALDIKQEEEKYATNFANCLYQSFLDCSIKTIRDYIEGIELDSSNLPKVIDTISTSLKHNKNKLNHEILTQANTLYQQYFAITHRFVGYYSDLFNKYCKLDCVKKSINSLSIIDMASSEIKIAPFSYDPNNSEHIKLFQLISSKANKLNIQIDKLINYHSSYANFDHGVISASLLYQAICFSNDIKNNQSENYCIDFAWSYYSDKDSDFLSICSEVIFSILLHNVYNKNSAPTYGIDYKHNIDIDPFSYFCTLCDTIQKWGRPKKINLANSHLPPNNYLEDEFDIDLSFGKITIKCTKNNINKTNSLIRTSELFLPGISKLIEVKEF